MSNLRHYAAGLRIAADLVNDEECGLPFDDDADRAIVASWLLELADDLSPS